MPRKTIPDPEKPRTRTFTFKDTTGGQERWLQEPPLRVTAKDRPRLGARFQLLPAESKRPKDSYYEHKILNALKLACKDAEGRFKLIGLTYEEEKGLGKLIGREWSTYVEQGADLIPMMTKHADNVHSNRFIKNKEGYFLHHFGSANYPSPVKEKRMIFENLENLYRAYRRANQLAVGIRKANAKLRCAKNKSEALEIQKAFVRDEVNSTRYSLDPWNASLISQQADIDTSDLYRQHIAYSNYFQLCQLAGCLARGGYYEITAEQFRTFICLYRELLDPYHIPTARHGRYMAQMCFEIIAQTLTLDIFFQIAICTIERDALYVGDGRIREH